MHVKVLNKTLHLISQHKIIHHAQIGFILSMQINRILHINRIKGKYHMNISSDAKRTFSKVQYPFMMKGPEETRIEGTYFNLVEAIYADW